VSLSETADGLVARLTGSQGSGLVSGLARADGLAVIPPGVDAVEPGDPVRVVLLDGTREPGDAA
jgi:molybdopterin biosynthesis enzyme